jgi:hypothetical protein
MDAGTSEGAKKAWEARAHGQHGVQKVEPTAHGGRYHVGKHQLEVSSKGGFVSHHQEGMQGSYDPKISRSVFPQVHQSVKAHLAEFGPHPEAGGEKKVVGKSSAGGQIKSNVAASRARSRAGF